MRKANEGLNFFYKLGALSLLRHMQKYPSLNYSKVLGKIREVLLKVDARLISVDEIPYCLGIRELEQLGLYKKKYPVYATYLAAISSYPILYRVGADADLTASILAKVASILSIKVLDNINDTIHDYDEAVRSLDKHEESLTRGEFACNHSNDLVGKAENTTYLMARWTYDQLREYVDDSYYSFASYRTDVGRYMIGQKESSRQKVFNGHIASIGLHEYLTKFLDKNVGNIWFDIDLCVYDRKLGMIDRNHLELIQCIKRSMECLHKATLLYDDVSDLQTDLQEKILNSVVIYGIERGHCSLEHLRRDPGWLVHKLDRARVLRDVLYLGDLFFSRGLEQLHKAKELSDGTIDIDALIFNLKVLRGFSMRKWVIQKKNLQIVMHAVRPFHTDKLVESIPDHIRAYEEALV